jgi:cytoskeletal protein RodZ
MTLSVGERLRQARLDLGLDLSDVVARTKISEKNLKAIETNDRSAIASGFFYRSFVEQYARALAIEPKELLNEVDRMLSAEAPLPLPGQNGERIHRPEPLYRPKKSYGRMVASLVTFVLAVFGCSAVYALWGSGRTPSLAAIASWVHPAQRESHPIATSAPRPLVAANSASAATPVPTTTSAEPATPLGTAPLLSRDYKLLLDLMAREETWLSVSSDGKPVFSGVLGPNQTKTVAGKEFAKLRVGNAGGLDVKLNGKSIGPLGGRGQVLVVVFTPDNFQIVPPAKESD